MTLSPDLNMRLAPHQGDWMRKALETSGLTGKDMAEYLGVSAGQVSRWINGKQPPTRQTKMLWALRTGVPLEYLETGLLPTGPTGGGVPGMLPEKLRTGILHRASGNVTAIDFRSKVAA